MSYRLLLLSSLSLFPLGGGREAAFGIKNSGRGRQFPTFLLMLDLRCNAPAVHCVLYRSTCYQGVIGLPPPFLPSFLLLSKRPCILPFPSLYMEENVCQGKHGTFAQVKEEKEKNISVFSSRLGARIHRQVFSFPPF